MGRGGFSPPAFETAPTVSLLLSVDDIYRCFQAWRRLGIMVIKTIPKDPGHADEDLFFPGRAKTQKLEHIAESVIHPER